MTCQIRAPSAASGGAKNLRGLYEVGAEGSDGGRCSASLGTRTPVAGRMALQEFEALPAYDVETASSIKKLKTKGEATKGGSRSTESAVRRAI